MNVTKVIETTDGEVTYTAELKGKELQVVIDVGLNTLLAAGALPFLGDESAQVIAPTSDTAQ